MATMRTLLTTLFVTTPLTLAAEGYAVREHLAGAKCMLLNLSFDQMMDESIKIPIRASPRQDATEIGTPGSTVIVRDTPASPNGYVEVMLADGRTGWLQERWLKPWASSTSPQRRCRPALFANGRVGFDIR